MSHGCFGVVQETKNQTLVKKKPHIISGKYLASFQNEVRIYKLLSSVTPTIKCIPRFYGLNSQKNDFTMQKIHPSLKHFEPSKQFFIHAFECLSRLHQYILHMDLGESNLGLRTTDQSIIFFDFGNSVSLNDLRDAGISNMAIDLYKEQEMMQLYEIFENLFPDKVDLLDFALEPFQKIKLPIRQKMRMKQELSDKAHQIVFQN